MNDFHSESRMLIDGKLVEAAGGATFDVINPATEEVIGAVADAAAVDMLAAIAAARNAFDGGEWASDKELRKRCLVQLVAALQAEKEAWRGELVAETGSPVILTYAPQLEWPLEQAFTMPLDLIDTFEWERQTGESEGTRRMITHEPVGVIGAIVPWNFPVETTLTKLAPMLAAGCTVVLKPAPDTPLNATRLGRIISEQTDIPAGVVNVVTTSDNAVAQLLATHHDVDGISFTGSTVTGRKLMAAGAETLKRLFLELGGKSAQIFLDDADFEKDLASTAYSCVHAGQGCAILTRALLPRSRYEEGVAIIEAAFKELAWGDPTELGPLMGPLASKAQYDKVLSYIEAGVAEGARLVVGGGRPERFEKGFYIEPTLFADVDNSMSIAQDEIFGPVLVVIPYDDDDDAVRIANDSPFGLAAGVVGSIDRATAIAKRLRVGSVSIGSGNVHNADTPFGGYKQSGFGRQNGVEGFAQYLEVKALGLPA